MLIVFKVNQLGILKTANRDVIEITYEQSDVVP